jgi:AraC-like DNA-binding protein
MLVARGQRAIGSADLRWAILFAPRVWSVVVERSGLILDTRFIPAATSPVRPYSCLYFLLRGSWTLHGEGGRRFDAPCAFVASETQLEGAEGRRPFTFSARGQPFHAIEVHAHDADLEIAPAAYPVPFRVDERVLSAAANVAHLSSHDDRTLERSFAEFLGHLAEQSVIGKAVAALSLRPPSKPFALLWTALRPMVERLYLNPTLQEVGGASGVSTRQLDRYVHRFVTSFGLVGERWRSSTLHIRLKLAILLLSADGASVADVARMVGYGSTDAMARTFRDAALPTPTAVQQAVRAARAEE